jgi:hypothetical protein
MFGGPSPLLTRAISSRAKAPPSNCLTTELVRSHGTDARDRRTTSFPESIRLVEGVQSHDHTVTGPPRFRFVFARCRPFSDEEAERPPRPKCVSQSHCAQRQPAANTFSCRCFLSNSSLRPTAMFSGDIDHRRFVDGSRPTREPQRRVTVVTNRKQTQSTELLKAGESYISTGSRLSPTIPTAILWHAAGTG